MNLKALIGIGLRAPHYQQMLEEQPAIGWLEVHSENFFCEGGPQLRMLSELRKTYPISLHGVGLSLGSTKGVQANHLERLAELIDRVQPFMVSEHLSWGEVGGRFIPDLLPLPYTAESLQVVCQNVNQTQEFLKRTILIENPSSYLEFKSSTFEEAAFLAEVCRKTGAKLLLDVNNVFVSCSNHGWNAKHYIDALPADLVEEIHLAGHSIKTLESQELLRIDTHNNRISNEVWDLYAYTMQKIGPRPSLIEWDTDIPELSVLLDEAHLALTLMKATRTETYA